MNFPMFPFAQVVWFSINYPKQSAGIISFIQVSCLPYIILAYSVRYGHFKSVSYEGTLQGTLRPFKCTVGSWRGIEL